ncbi:MAG: uroporphyrinogen decarboxylase family protein [Eubacteriales bacterium]
MQESRLRNHIPLSAPATREPCTGDEADLRVSLGFVPRWYHERLDIDFSRQWHTDPVYRYESLVRMKTYLHEIFPTVSYFTPNYNKDNIEPACATISGVHGIKLIPMVYGLETQYFNDNWPDNLAGQVLSKEHLANLEPIDVAKTPVIVQLLEQMDIIEKTYGQIQGYLNYQGILNIAVKLRGTEIFMDIYDDPEFAHYLFNHIANTILQVSKLVQARQRKSGFEVNLLSMSNCVMNMVSADTYREFVLPYDLMLSKEFERFGVHTCNWNITPYIDVLRSIDKMGYIDMGMVSDMKRVRDVFPDARRAVMYPPVELEQKTMDEIKADIQKIFDDLAPCDIIMADITDTTPDERVREFLEVADSFNK